MTRKESNPEAPDEPSFEEALARLETIVGLLEEGEIGLAESLAQYEEGVKLLKQCYGLLSRAERRIELLSGFDAAGEPVTEPFDESDMSLEEKALKRSQRRSTTKPGKKSPAKKSSTKRPAAKPAREELGDEAPEDDDLKDDEPGLF